MICAKIVLNLLFICVLINCVYLRKSQIRNVLSTQRNDLIIYFFINEFLMFFTEILLADEEEQLVNGLNIVLDECNENRFGIKNDEDGLHRQ